MTSSTEQERAEFGANSKAEFAIEFRNLKRRIADLECELQAARRAPVVPQGWVIVPTDASLNMLDAGWGICSLNGQPSEAKIDSARKNYAAMLAAAPQPPEATEKPTTEQSSGVAAPVHFDPGALKEFLGAAKEAGVTHLPKSFGKALREHIEAQAPVQLPEYGIDTANHACVRVRGYTEQQVRQLLAAQEQST